MERKVLILSCGTGEGHNSTAYAVKEALDGLDVRSEILDPLSLKSERIRAAVSATYNNVIKKIPSAFGLVYRLGAFYDRLPLPSPVYRANSKYAFQLYNYIKLNHFTEVVCTHIFAMEAMTAVKRLYGNVPTYGVLTDYVVIPFFKDSDLDGYFVGTEDLKRTLVESGYPEKDIFCTGIPVKKGFSDDVSATDAKSLLDIPDDKRVITVMSGGVGCGHLERLCSDLNKKFGDEFYICVLCGRNEKLKSDLDRKYSDSDKFRTVPFTRDAYLYVKASEMVLTKPGGLSSTEIAVAGVPLVHLKPIPGCETYNYKYFVRNGLSMPGKTCKQAAVSARKLADDVALRRYVTDNQKRAIHADSAEEIADRLTRA